jgi:hypothetical protein
MTHYSSGGEMRKLQILIATACLLFLSAAVIAGSQDDSELLKVRRSVWLVWLANDQEALKRLVPDDTVVISAGEAKWAPGGSAAIGCGLPRGRRKID